MGGHALASEAQAKNDNGQQGDPRIERHKQAGRGEGG